MRRAVTRDRAAFLTFMYDNISFLRIHFCGYRLHYAAAFVRSVSRIYVNVERAEAERAVISRRVAEGKHLFTAIFADKTAVVFRKPFALHT